SPCYRHPPESAIDIGSVENCLAGPRSPSSIVGGRKNERRTSSNIDSLQVPIREESNRLSVGRPKGKFPAFRSREWLCRRPIHGPQEQHSLSLGCTHKHQVASVRRDRRGSSFITQRVHGYAVGHRKNRTQLWRGWGVSTKEVSEAGTCDDQRQARCCPFPGTLDSPPFRLPEGSGCSGSAKCPQGKTQISRRLETVR